MLRDTVIIGEDQDRVDDTVETLAKDGTAYGITADLTDRDLDLSDEYVRLVTPGDFGWVRAFKKQRLSSYRRSR